MDKTIQDRIDQLAIEMKPEDVTLFKMELDRLVTIARREGFIEAIEKVQKL